MIRARVVTLSALETRAFCCACLRAAGWAIAICVTQAKNAMMNIFLMIANVMSYQEIALPHYLTMTSMAPGNLRVMPSGPTAVTLI